MTAAERMRRYSVSLRDAGLRSATSWKPRRALDEIKAKTPLIRTLAKAYGATAIYLFGSAARGQDKPGSDLDFMVEMEQGRGLYDLIGLADDLELALGRKVDLGTRTSLKPLVRVEAERDAIRIV